MSDPIFRFEVLPLDASKGRRGCRGKLLPGERIAWLPYEDYGTTPEDREKFRLRLKEGASNIFVCVTGYRRDSDGSVIWDVTTCAAKEEALDRHLLEWENALEAHRQDPESARPLILSMYVTTTPGSHIYGLIMPGIEGTCDRFYDNSTFKSRWNPAGLTKDMRFADVVTGDCLAGIVTKVDREKRLITLEPEQVIEMVDRNPLQALELFEFSVSSPPFVPSWHSRSKEEPFALEQFDHRWQFRSIVVVEDDQALAAAMRDELTQPVDGAEVPAVTVATSFEDAQQLIETRDPLDFDCGIIDASLERESLSIDTRGLQLIRRLQERGAQCRILLVSGGMSLDALLDTLAPEDEGPVVHGILHKVYTPRELHRALAELSARVGSHLRSFVVGQPAGEQPSHSAHEAPKGQDPRDVASRIVGRLRRETNADSCILFEIDPMKLNDGQVYAHAPDIYRYFVSRPSEYQYSPISDVALRRQIFAYDYDPLKQEPTHRKLLKMHSAYCWCIGVPVPAEAGKRYALFLFRHVPVGAGDCTAQRRMEIRGNRGVPAFVPSDLANAHKAAGEIGAILTANSYEHVLDRERVQGRQAMANAMWIHQVRSAFTNFGLEASKLQRVLDAQESAEQRLSEVRSSLEGMSQVLGEAWSMEDRRKQESAAPRESKILLGELLDRACNYAAPYLQQKKVSLQADYGEAREIYLLCDHRKLAQAFYNLLANAAELIDIFAIKPHSSARWRNGIVQVKYTPEKAPGSENMARILIADTGPGIHLYQWEPIWETCVTTKDEGTGLGLTFARRVISECKGEVFVARSLLFVGTVFEVRLPIHSRALGSQIKGRSRS